MSSERITITHEPGRYTLRLGERQAAVADHRTANGVRTFTHTYVEPDLRDRGLAGRLIAHALDATRDEGLRVVARCSYVAAFIEGHPEYRDLLV